MTSQPTLTRTQEAQEALDRIEDRGTHVFARMLYALVVQRAFGERKIETEMNIDSYFLIRVFEEYFSDRDAVYKALSMGNETK
jgi:hypothetical protein